MKTPDTVYPDAPRIAVGAVVFKQHRVLLVKRGKPPAQALWAIPGGSVKLGETLQQAAEREILEEAGITIAAREPLFVFDMVERDETGRVRFHYLIVDLAADYISGELQAGDDAESARWVAAEELNALPVSATTVDLLCNKLKFGRQ